LLPVCCLVQVTVGALLIVGSVASTATKLMGLFVMKRGEVPLTAP
jgi:hypothetical protein